MEEKIYLIAGHNGKGTGACGFIDEGEETIVFRNLLWQALLRKNKKNVMLEKEDDKLQVVANYLKRRVKPDDICIDIHFNSSSNAQANGAEIFVPENPSEKEKLYAKKILQTICETLDVKSRGIKTEG